MLAHPSGFAYEVYHRCTGVPVVALLATGLLALPRGRRRKLPGIACGAVLVLAVNLLRLVSLFHLGVRLPRVFDFAHSVVWEGGMILLVVGFWLLWLGPAGRAQAPSGSSASSAAAAPTLRPPSRSGRRVLLSTPRAVSRSRSRSRVSRARRSISR